MKPRFEALVVWAALGAAVPLGAQEQPHVFRGATIYPIAGAPIPNGVLVVRNGKVDLVGGPETRIPDGAVVHDVPGKVILPGLVDTHSHIGGAQGGDRSSPINPAVRALDALNARDDGIQRAQAGGITTVNVMPGSGHLMSGQTAYLKLRDANTIQQMLFCRDALRDVCGGMKMANGTNPRGEPPFPGTRAKAAALVREKFIQAREYREKIRKAGKDEKKMPTRDLEMEALVEILDGKRTVHFHTHRADDILTALRLGQEFGFVPVLHHVSEAWKVAGEIAAAGAPASIIVLDTPGGKLEATEIRMENGAALERANALVAYHTDDLITDSRWFLRSAGLGVRAGMSRDKALEAMTLAGAKMLRLDDRVGSLERGKDADFVVLSGDPFSVYTQVEQTWVEGNKVFDRANARDRAFATGGYGVYGEGEPHTHEDLEGHE
jgi:imidazolonepropionase-like amidohydrolase